MKHILMAFAAATLAGCVASTTVGGSGTQLQNSVASRLAFYGIDVVPEALTLDQAAALHTLLVQRKGWLETRRRAETILTAPRFRD